MFKKMICWLVWALIVTQAGLADEVARWDFEETSGATASDQSGQLVVNLAGSDSLGIEGKFGSGIDFAGDGGATMDVAASEILRFTEDFSIVLWINSDVPVADYTRFVDMSAADGGLADSYRLMTGNAANADNFRFMSRQSGSNTSRIHTRDLVPDTWTLLVARHDLDGEVTLSVLEEGDAARGPAQGLDPVPATPVQGRTVDVDAPGAVARIPADPLAGQRRRPAEVLAQEPKGPSSLAAIDPGEEVQVQESQAVGAALLGPALHGLRDGSAGESAGESVSFVDGHEYAPLYINIHIYVYQPQVEINPLGVTGVVDS